MCTEGVKITVEEAKLLKHFGHQLAEFKAVPLAVWEAPGTFEKFKIDGKYTESEESENESDN